MSYNPYSSYCPPVSPVSTEPTTYVQNIYHPQIVPVIHPIEIVNKHICVPIPKHMCSYTVKDEVAGYSNYAYRSKSSRGRSRG